MISYLSGELHFQSEKYIIIMASGVGYKVFCGADTLLKMPQKGNIVNVWTHQHIREDAIELYGFLHRSELELFELLISISGVGPKTALGVMGMAPVDTLRRAIAAGDTTYLTKVSGIGRKIAEKIILELREKMSGKGMVVESGELREESDALDALISLGYTQAEAREALSHVPASITGAKNRITEALKKLSHT